MALSLSRWIVHALQTNTGSECDTDEGIDIVTDESNDNSLVKGYALVANSIAYCQGWMRTWSDRVGICNHHCHHCFLYK